MKLLFSWPEAEAGPADPIDMSSDNTPGTDNASLGSDDCQGGDGRGRHTGDTQSGAPQLSTLSPPAPTPLPLSRSPNAVRNRFLRVLRPSQLAAQAGGRG